MTPDLSRFKVRRPCRNCPFRSDGTRIRFASRERAEEIEEQAYRQGFPCHETAACREDPRTGEEGYVFDESTSFCIGYVIMRLKANGDDDPWPAIGNDGELLETLSEELGAWWNTPVFDSEEAFFTANESEEAKPARNGQPEDAD